MGYEPFERASIARHGSKQAWDATAGELVASMLARWRLTALDAFTGGEVGVVLRVVTREGRPAVLKVGYPHPEGVWEAVGLERLASLAPEVFRQEPWTWSLLLAEVLPGVPLSRAELPRTEAVRVGARTLAAVAQTDASGLPTIAAELSPVLSTALARLPGDRARLDAVAFATLESGLAELRMLLDSPGGDQFVHGDLNPGNVLRSGAAWVVIDPSPLRGDAAFDLWPLLSQLGVNWAEHPEATLRDGLDVAASESGVDAERAVRWAIARSALNISWFLEDRNPRAAAAAVRQAQAWRRLAG